VRLYIVTKKSLFYLLYKIYSKISVNENDSLKTDVIADEKKRIVKINYAKILVNELLFNRAIKINKIKNIKVVKTSFEKNDKSF
jgi:hypothetical protein